MRHEPGSPVIRAAPRARCRSLHVPPRARPPARCASPPARPVAARAPAALPRWSRRPARACSSRVRSIAALAGRLLPSMPRSAWRGAPRSPRAPARGQRAVTPALPASPARDSMPQSAARHAVAARRDQVPDDAARWLACRRFAQLRHEPLVLHQASLHGSQFAQGVVVGGTRLLQRLFGSGQTLAQFLCSALRRGANAPPTRPALPDAACRTAPPRICVRIRAASSRYAARAPAVARPAARSRSSNSADDRRSAVSCSVAARRSRSRSARSATSAASAASIWPSSARSRSVLRFRFASTSRRLSASAGSADGENAAVNSPGFGAVPKSTSGNSTVASRSAAVGSGWSVWIGMVQGR